MDTVHLELARWPDGARLFRTNDYHPTDLSLVYLPIGAQLPPSSPTGMPVAPYTGFRLSGAYSGDTGDLGIDLNGHWYRSQGLIALPFEEREIVEARVRWAMLSLIPDLATRTVGESMVQNLLIPRVLAVGFEQAMSKFGPSLLDEIHEARREDEPSAYSDRRQVEVLERVRADLSTPDVLRVIDADEPPRILRSDYDLNPCAVYTVIYASNNGYTLACGAYRMQEFFDYGPDHAALPIAEHLYEYTFELDDRMAWFIWDATELAIGAGKTVMEAVESVPYLVTPDRLEAWLEAHTDPGELSEDPEVYHLLGQAPPCLWDQERFEQYARERSWA
jgi:hypothetical protein